MMVHNVSSFYSGQQVEKAHDADLHCVDWNPHDDNLILTGYDPTLQLFWFSCLFRQWVCDGFLGLAMLPHILCFVEMMETFRCFYFSVMSLQVCR